MSEEAEYEIAYSLRRRKPGDDDYAEIGFGSLYDESSLATVQAHHVAQVTEAAVREQIAAEIEAAAECRSWIADSALIQGMREAAEIARGEA